MAYINQADLEALISPEALFAIYNDNNAGEINASALALIIQIACSEVDSYIARNYPGPFPIPDGHVPVMVKHAALLWARAFSYERHREYARMFAATARTQAHDFSERLAAGESYLTDYSTPTPQNVGGIMFDNSNRVVIDSADGTKNSGDF